MRLPRLLSILMVGILPLAIQAQSSVSRQPSVNQPSAACGDFFYSATALGPLDYRTATPEQKHIVENVHFSTNVERLIKGERGTIGGDLAYTLRVFPNHPRALRSAAEWQRRNRGLLPPDMQYTMDCWFDRAVAYRPDDAQVRIVWAFELIKAKQNTAALEQVTKAEQLAKGNPQIHYNVGLLYFDLKEYDKSLANARIAYEQGFNLPGLKDKLTKAGKWKE